MKVILWTGNESQVAELRAAIREKGHVCLIRNAAGFQSGSDAEPCNAIAFHQAANKDFILACYRSEGYVARAGHVELIDLELGAHGEPVKVPDLPPPPPPPKTEADFLDDRLDNLDYDSLRTYVKAVTGEDPAPALNDPPNDDDRAALIALLRKVASSAAPAPVVNAVEETTTETVETPPQETSPANEPAAGGRGARKPRNQ